MAPWPVGAAGTGAVLCKKDLLTFGNDPVAWETKAPIGSPVTDLDQDGMPDWWSCATA